eukprot:1169353_1
MAQANTDELPKEDNNKNPNEEEQNKQNKKRMDAAQLANLKQLRIQSGALSRYTKELKSYMKELTDLNAQLDQMRRNNDDEKQSKTKKIEIKQQRQAIEETENVIRDIRPKLVSTWENVDQLISELDGYTIEDEQDIELFDKTKVFLEAAEPLVND